MRRNWARSMSFDVKFDCAATSHAIHASDSALIARVWDILRTMFEVMRAGTVGVGRVDSASGTE